MDKKKIVIITCLIASLIIVCIVAVVINNNSDNKIDFSIKGNEEELPYETDNPVVAMNVKGYGTIVVELYPDVAPNTVNNFVNLVLDGFYDGNSFHRYVAGFCLQGGDPDGDGTGGPGYTIKGEFTKNSFKNTLKHTRGVISMARSSSYNSAGSQFFITLGTQTSLDGLYATFGKVIDGMDVIEKIEKKAVVSDTSSGKLKNNITITKMVVDKNNTEIKDTVKVEN